MASAKNDSMLLGLRLWGGNIWQETNILAWRDATKKILQRITKKKWCKIVYKKGCKCAITRQNSNKGATLNETIFGSVKERILVRLGLKDDQKQNEKINK
jgi:hypothetical protein